MRPPGQGGSTPNPSDPQPLPSNFGKPRPDGRFELGAGWSFDVEGGTFYNDQPAELPAGWTQDTGFSPGPPTQNSPAKPTRAPVPQRPQRGKKKMPKKNPRPRASQAVAELRQAANLLGGLLRMPNTAAHVRQAALVAEALHEVSSVYVKHSRTASVAARIAIQDLLNATDHLMWSPSPVARALAPKIEAHFLAALPPQIRG